MNKVANSKSDIGPSSFLSLPFSSIVASVQFSFAFCFLLCFKVTKSNCPLSVFGRQNGWSVTPVRVLKVKIVQLSCWCSKGRHLLTFQTLKLKTKLQCIYSQMFHAIVVKCERQSNMKVYFKTKESFNLHWTKKERKRERLLPHKGWPFLRVCDASSLDTYTKCGHTFIANRVHFTRNTSRPQWPSWGKRRLFTVHNRLSIHLHLATLYPYLVPWLIAIQIKSTVKAIKYQATE